MATDITPDPPQAVTGTVTANAGTNLNTSTLALEAGGNLAAVAASASVLDDWDETDRAKVNPIAGQAGVQGGAGAVTALTQRIVIATDQTAIPVTGAGGGTEYVGDAAATATPTGAVAMGLANAAAPSDVSANNDAVAAWHLRNGAAATVLTAAGALIGGDATFGVDVDVTRSALPAGASTETTLAAISTVQGAVADAVVAAGATGSVSAKLRRATQGLEDLKTGIILAAGSAAIGKLAANSGVDIGDVDVTSLPALVAGTANIGDVDVLTMPGTGVEDAAETAGGTLVMSGTVRRDTPASSAGTTGDNATLNTDALGHVWVTLPGIVRISQTPTVSTSPAYTAKDTVGGLLTFANAVRVSGGSGLIVGVTVIDLGITPSTLELSLFNQTFTASTDNAIYDPTDADLANALPSIAINSWQIFSDNSLASVSGLAIPILLTGTSLFGQLRTLGTPTYAGTTDITVMLEILQN